MNHASVDSAALSLRRARRAAGQRAVRAAMTPTQRSLHLQRRRDRYRSRCDTVFPTSVPVSVSLNLPPPDSISSLGALSLAAPSVFASTSDDLQPLFSNELDAVVGVLQSHVDREVFRMFGSSLHCPPDPDSSELAVDIGLPLHATGRPVNSRAVTPTINTERVNVNEEQSLLSLVPRSRAHVRGSRSMRRSPLQRSTYNCARNYVDSPTYEPFVLPLPKLCCHCNAKLFPFESASFCCKKGQICLPYQAPPADLLSLYTGMTPDAIHFQNNLRSYNHVFSFTSMGVHLDSDLASGTNGVYTYRAQGAIYHRIGSFLPRPDERPRFMQLYVFDTEHELENRIAENDSLRPL